MTTQGPSVEQYVYDALGRMTSVVKDGVQLDRRLYDGAGRVVLSGPADALPTGYTAAVNQGLPAGASNGLEMRVNRYDANGSVLHHGDRDLRVGQTLNIPNLVAGVHNDSGSYKPYDPSKIKGDTLPNLPNPPPAVSYGGGGGGGCGGIGMIIVAIVAVVAAVFTVGASLAASSSLQIGLAETFALRLESLGSAALGVGSVGPGTAALAGAVGSIASQVVGNAIGVQDGFSWKQVAFAAIGGAVSNVVGTALPGEGFGNVVARAAVGSVISQGIGVVTGLQEKFSWRGVAASAVGAGVGYGVSQAVGGALQNTDFAANNSGLAGFGVRAVSGLAAGLTTAAMRGGRVNATQVATDAFGNALGGSLAEAFGQTSGSITNSQQIQALSEIGQETSRASLPASYWSMTADAGAVTGTMNDATPTGSRDVVRISVEDPEADAVVRENQVSAWERLLREKHPGESADVIRGVAESLTAQGKRAGATGAQSSPTALPEVTVTAPRMTPEEAARYDAEQAQRNYGSYRPIGPIEGFFTFNGIGRTLKGAGQAVYGAVAAVPTIFRQAALTAGDVGGYAASAAPWVPKHQPESALFQTLQRDGPAPIVRGIVGAAVAPLKQVYEGGMYGRYETLGEGILGTASLGAMGVTRGARLSNVGEVATIAGETASTYRATEFAWSFAPKPFASGRSLSLDYTQLAGKEVEFARQLSLQEAGLNRWIEQADSG